MICIQKISTEGIQLDAARVLFAEYEKELDADLCFQSFEEELKNPLLKYGAPKGALLLAFFDNKAIGCVALKPMPDNACEMKRLYVQPNFRKHKTGEALVNAILAEAKQLQYNTIKLDTLERLSAAVALYKKFGFKTVDPYYKNPLEGVLFMEKSLA